MTTGAFKTVAVLAHPQIETAAAEAQRVAEYLRSHNLEAHCGMLDDDGLRQMVARNQVDLVMTLGGDGTVLRAGHLCAPHNIPILAINLGRFGFLIEISQDGWRRAVDDLVAGKYWIEQRLMLAVSLVRNDQPIETWEALNEAVVGRGHSVRPVHLAALLEGSPLTTYVADALVVATPTGSTAYALAAGGPILPPEMRNYTLVPVAPHISLDRSIVLAENATVSIEVMSDHECVLSVDGQTPYDLETGDRVDVCVSQHTVQFVRFQEAGYFYRNLIQLMDQNPSAGVIK